MPLRATWHTIKQNVPAPAWIRWPEQQRFCGCCSIRTGASLIGWFNFIFNSLYVGMLLLSMTELRNLLDDTMYVTDELSDLVPDPTKFSGNVTMPTNVTNTTASVLYTALPPDERDFMKKMIEYTLPIMYKSICIPAIMIVFSVLWLITVEAQDIRLTRLFGRAFAIAIVVQILLQLGFLIYVDLKSRDAFGFGISWIVWIIFVFYSLLNVYFIPILSEYIRRRIRESASGMEQGLLTSEMYPRARVAEEYIQDAFTVEADVDMVQFQASLAKPDKKEKEEEEVKDEIEPSFDIDDEYSPI